MFLYISKRHTRHNLVLVVEIAVVSTFHYTLMYVRVHVYQTCSYGTRHRMIVKYPEGIERENKAGYTAISRVWLGRGSNAQKLMKKKVLTDRRTDRPTNGRTNGRTPPLIEMRGRI